MSTHEITTEGYYKQKCIHNTIRATSVILYNPLTRGVSLHPRSAGRTRA